MLIVVLCRLTGKRMRLPYSLRRSRWHREHGAAGRQQLLQPRRGDPGLQVVPALRAKSKILPPANVTRGSESTALPVIAATCEVATSRGTKEAADHQRSHGSAARRMEQLHRRANPSTGDTVDLGENNSSFRPPHRDLGRSRHALTAAAASRSNHGNGC
jgi:hypothetical protein